MEATPHPVARRHHTVPQFYLRGFSDDGHLATVRLPGEQRFVQSVNDASVAKNFYSVEGHEGGADVLENALSEVEGATAKVLKRIEKGVWPLATEERMTLGYFIALQATRVPVQRRSMDHVARQIMRLQIGAGGKPGLRKQLERQGGKVTDETVERVWEMFTRPEGAPFSRPQVEHLQHMLRLAEEIVKYIVGRPWTLVRFDRRSLITSDAPVGLVPDPEDEPWQGVGFMTSWGITFPLSRKLGLIMSDPKVLIDLRIPVEKVHAGNADIIQLGTTMLEKFINYNTVVSASEWLFHHPQDDKFVPEELPESRPVHMSMLNELHEFDGTPWFGSSAVKVQ